MTGFFVAVLTVLCTTFAAVAEDRIRVGSTYDADTNSVRLDTLLRPVLSVYSIEAGTAHIAQTYLSPLHNSGAAIALGYDRSQAMAFDPSRWVMSLGFRLDGARTFNEPARNKVLWDMSLRASWSMMRRWNVGAWSFFAGGHTALDAGAQYVPANGNNPVAAKASWTIGASAAAAYHTALARKPLTLRYLAEMPLTGVFFAPEYGELYYEIYLGNHRGLVRGAWPGNFFRYSGLLSADVRLGSTILRLGYRLNISSVKASDIVCNNVGHMAVLAIASEWISLSPTRRPSPQARIISSLY